MCCVSRSLPGKMLHVGEWPPRLDIGAVRGCVSRRNPGASGAVFSNAPARRPGWRSADTGSGTLLFSQSCSDVIGLPLALALSELLRAASEGDGASGEPPDLQRRPPSSGSMVLASDGHHASDLAGFYPRAPLETAGGARHSDCALAGLSRRGMLRTRPRLHARAPERPTATGGR